MCKNLYYVICCCHETQIHAINVGSKKSTRLLVLLMPSSHGTFGFHPSLCILSDIMGYLRSLTGLKCEGKSNILTRSNIHHYIIYTFLYIFGLIKYSWICLELLTLLKNKQGSTLTRKKPPQNDMRKKTTWVEPNSYFSHCSSTITYYKVKLILECYVLNTTWDLGIYCQIKSAGQIIMCPFSKVYKVCKFNQLWMGTKTSPVTADGEKVICPVR